ncbi:MAG: protein BatD [Deltaproteobacteria bacterium]|nr:protein BatD [Deltaproteobacteria bacterium]
MKILHPFLFVTLVLTTWMVFGIIPAHGSPVTVELLVDRTSIPPGEQVSVTVRVSGVGDASAPDIVGVDSFEVESQGTSTRMEIINGQVSRGVDYNYLITPKKSGQVTLGPAKVRVGGMTYSSQAVVLSIAEPKQANDETKEVFFTAGVSEKNPYVGQQIMLTLTFGTSLPISQANLRDFDLKEFTHEKLENTSPYTRMINGRHYSINELKYILFPQKAGPLTIEPIKITCDLPTRSQRRSSSGFLDEQFFGLTRMVTRSFSSEPINLMVKDLPVKGRPPDFQGLIGHFKIHSELSKPTVKVGESVTLSIRMEGTGNVRLLTTPALGELPLFKVYEDQPTFTVKTKPEGLFGTKTVKRALVPEKPGGFTIPPVSITYFDPTKAAYQRVATSPLALTVTPAAAAEATRVTVAASAPRAKEEVTALGKDILPNHTGMAALVPQALYPGPLLIAVWFLPPFILLGLSVMTRRRHLLSGWFSDRRRRQAYAVFQRELGALPAGNEAASNLVKALKSFVSHKTGWDAGAMTLAELVEMLNHCKADPRLVAALAGLGTRLEENIYSAQKLSQVDLTELKKELAELVRDLDKEASLR